MQKFRMQSESGIAAELIRLEREIYRIWKTKTDIKHKFQIILMVPSKKKSYRSPCVAALAHLCVVSTKPAALGVEPVWMILMTEQQSTFSYPIYIEVFRFLQPFENFDLLRGGLESGLACLKTSPETQICSSYREKCQNRAVSGRFHKTQMSQEKKTAPKRYGSERRSRF